MGFNQLASMVSLDIALNNNSGLYYKAITIVIMMIVSDATIWSITYDRN